MMADDEITTTISATGEGSNEMELDMMFIAAMVCCGLGGLLILVGFCRLIVYVCNSREDGRAQERYLRQLEHIRRVEQYSLRTGASPDEFLVKRGGSPRSAASLNAGFHWEEPRAADAGNGAQYVIRGAPNGHGQNLPVVITAGTNDLSGLSGSYPPDALIIDDSRSSIRGADVHF